MKRKLCFMLDCRHVMKVIWPYQLDVADNVCFMKSWHCNTCGCQAIQISPTYINTNIQTYTKYFLSLLFNQPCFKCFVCTQIIPSSTQLSIILSFLISFLPLLFPSFPFLIFHYCLVSLFLSSYHLFLILYFRIVFLSIFTLSFFFHSFFFPYFLFFYCLTFILLTWRIWRVSNNSSR